MDVDFSLIKINWDVPEGTDWGELQTQSRDGVFYIRQDHENISNDVATLAISFLNKVFMAHSELLSGSTSFEMAFYYDVEKRTYFSTSVSSELMSFLGSHNIDLNIVGYPCDE